MRFRIPHFLLISLLALTFGSSTARAAGAYPDFTVLGGGLTTPSTIGACLTGESLCLPNEVLDLNGQGIATGVISVADAGNTFATFNLAMPSASFTGLSGNVAEVLFSNLNYSGSAPVFANGDPLVSFTASPVGLGGVTLSGTYDVRDSLGASLGGGSLSSVPTVPLTLDCLITTGFGQCNVNLMPFTLNLDGVDHDFVHTLNLIVDPPLPLPEPSSGLLGMVVLAGLALRARR